MAEVETPRGRLARRKEPKMVVDRIRTGVGLALLFITAVPSIALVELSVIVVVLVFAVLVVAEVRCAFSAGCDVGLSLSGTCLEKNSRATLISWVYVHS